MPKCIYEPLQWPFDWENLSPFQRIVLNGIPFIGLQCRAKKSIERQLLARTEQAITVWPDDHCIREIADKISFVAQQEFGWPNKNFIPNDPFDIIFWDYTEDLVIVEADIVLTSEFNLPEDVSFIDMAQNKMLFIDVVNKVSGLRSQSGQSRDRTPISEIR